MMYCENHLRTFGKLFKQMWRERKNKNEFYNCNKCVACWHDKRTFINDAQQSFSLKAIGNAMMFLFLFTLLPIEFSSKKEKNRRNGNEFDGFVSVSSETVFFSFLLESLCFFLRFLSFCCCHWFKLRHCFRQMKNPLRSL